MFLLAQDVNLKCELARKSNVYDVLLNYKRKRWSEVTTRELYYLSQI